MTKYKCLVCGDICESNTTPENCRLCGASSSKFVELEQYKKEKMQKQAQINQTIQENKSKGIACCPKCGSTSIQPVQRGYSLFSGFIGSGKTMNYCMNCGHKWDPKKK